ncbi:MAG: YbgC/FadM family acyl-CoA thioesterase [Gammaproteobacteria bacterium]
MEDVCFKWPCRVYYEDTDGQGILYHGRCLNYFERARTEWIRTLGVNQSEWLTQGVGFVLSSVSLTYRAPAFLDDYLIATVSLTERRRTYFTVTQRLLRSSEAGRVCEDGINVDQYDVASAKSLVEGVFCIAFVDIKRFKPKAIPPILSVVLSV